MFYVEDIKGNKVSATVENGLALIDKTGKPVVYTYGFEYRGTSTHRVSISREDAEKNMRSDSFWDMTEEESVIHLNGYSDNDMW